MNSRVLFEEQEKFRIDPVKQQILSLAAKWARRMSERYFPDIEKEAYKNLEERFSDIDELCNYTTELLTKVQLDKTIKSLASIGCVMEKRLLADSKKNILDVRQLNLEHQNKALSNRVADLERENKELKKELASLKPKNNHWTPSMMGARK